MMHKPVWSQVLTRSPDEGCEVVRDSYASNRLRVRGRVERFRFEQTRCDLGEVRFDTFQNTLITEYQVDPLERLLVVRMLDHELEIDTDHTHRRIGPGDIALLAPPDREYVARLHGARMQFTVLNPSLLQAVADTDAHTLRRLILQPLAPERARQWQRTVDFVRTTMLDDDGANASPLVLGAAGRLLAASLLAAFSPQEPADSRADRHDSTPVTVRRAVAYLEANPDLDIGVADIARACHVSVRALQLAFRRHLDTTPMTYLRRVRIDRAHADLGQADPGSGATVSAIAARWGFTDPSRFRALYRDAYHRSPGATLRGH